jgi:DNA-binding FadR family transcriptional regulator
VFESLSRAILSGELAPGTILTTQRKLSSQFGVSPLVVRQATHRLEDFGPVLDWAEGQALHAMHAGDSAPAASSSKRPRK